MAKPPQFLLLCSHSPKRQSNEAFENPQKPFLPVQAGILVFLPAGRKPNKQIRQKAKKDRRRRKDIRGLVQDRERHKKRV